MRNGGEALEAETPLPKFKGEKVMSGGTQKYERGGVCSNGLLTGCNQVSSVNRAFEGGKGTVKIVGHDMALTPSPTWGLGDRSRRRKADPTQSKVGPPAEKNEVHNPGKKKGFTGLETTGTSTQVV